MSFLLPNLFTLSGVFCGFYAIVLSADLTPQGAVMAALSIFAAGIFDLIDGRIARLTGTQSEFGQQLDSLADLVSFGIAPSILMYAWGLHALGFAGIVAAFVYLACAAMRLARFNVTASDEVASPTCFVGLPTPPAAILVSASIVANYPWMPDDATSAQIPALAMLIVGALMVSRLPYRTFKNPGRSWANLMPPVSLIGLWIVVGLNSSVATGLVTMLSVYVVFGPLEQLGRWIARGDRSNGSAEPGLPGG